MKGNQQQNNSGQPSQYNQQQHMQNTNKNPYQQYNNTYQQNLYYQQHPYPFYQYQQNPAYYNSSQHYYNSQSMQKPQDYNQSYQIQVSQQKATDPRKRRNEVIKTKEQKNSFEKAQKKIIPLPSESEGNSSSQDQEKIYSKKKIIKKHPVFDSPQQIKRWIQARKKNYPKLSQNEEKIRAVNRQLNSEMSILETKLRKKISILNSDPRSILKKARTLDVLKKILLRRRTNRPKENKIKNWTNTKAQYSYPKIHQQHQQKFIQNQQEEKEKQIRPVNADISELSIEEVDSLTPQQQPIPKQPIVKQIPVEIPRRKPIDLEPQEIIEHLRQRQKQDRQLTNSLLQYKSNSFNYKYSCRTLQTNFQLEQIFKESIYMLQAIRYIVNNQFFQQQSK